MSRNSFNGDKLSRSHNTSAVVAAIRKKLSRVAGLLRGPRRSFWDTFLRPPLGGPIHPPPLKIAPYFFFGPLLRRIFPLWRASRRRIEERFAGTASPRPLVSPNPGRVMDRPRAHAGRRPPTLFAPTDTGRPPQRWHAATDALHAPRHPRPLFSFPTADYYLGRAAPHDTRLLPNSPRFIFYFLFLVESDTNTDETGRRVTGGGLSHHKIKLGRF
jgi:hypothetical protein